MNGEVQFICMLGLIIVGLPAMLILLTALAPSYVERAREVMRSRPGRSLLLGLVNFLFFAALSVLVDVDFAPAAFAGVFALLIVLPLFVLIGLVIAAGITGEQIWLQIASRPGSLLGSLIIGIIVLGFTALVPIFGWLILMGLTSSGLGAAITALVQRKRPQSEPAPPVEAG